MNNLNFISIKDDAFYQKVKQSILNEIQFITEIDTIIEDISEGKTTDKVYNIILDEIAPIFIVISNSEELTDNSILTMMVNRNLLSNLIVTDSTIDRATEGLLTKKDKINKHLAVIDRVTYDTNKLYRISLEQSEIPESILKILNKEL